MYLFVILGFDPSQNLAMTEEKNKKQKQKQKMRSACLPA